MAEKRYKLTDAAKNSWWFGQVPANTYQFRTGWTTTMPGGGTMYHNPKSCPTVTVGATDVVGTTNEGAQKCMEMSMVPKGIADDPEAGQPVFEETTDAVTIDLDGILPS